MKIPYRRAALLVQTTLLVLLVTGCAAQDGGNVLVVVNRASKVSQRIGDYYMHRRAVPAKNLCRVDTTSDEEISRHVFEAEAARPIAKCLTSRALVEQILYVVTTLGVPLKIAGTGEAMRTTAASVDSELATLYATLHGAPVELAGSQPNPMFGQLTKPFRHPDAAMYMVTRLAGFDYEDVKAMIDRGMEAVNRGKVVIDLRADENTPGNQWLRDTAKRVPKERLVLDESAKVLYDEKDVIAYAGWGFNDPDRHRRTVGFQWLPGAIMTEFVSNNGRTFARPPERWTLGTWKDVSSWFAGSPQNLSADEIRVGVTGASGHAYEPYLVFTPRPDAVIPAYLAGRNLAESYYTGIRALSWQNIVIGDPLCRLAARR